MIETLFAIVTVIAFLALLGYGLLSKVEAATRKTQRHVYYRHHDASVWVRQDLKGRHREHCLCYECSKFKPGKQDHCRRAIDNYDWCVKYDMVSPVWECPSFRLKD